MLVIALGAALLLMQGNVMSSASHAFDPEAIARAYLSSNAPAGVASDARRLELIEVQESPGAHHVRLQETIDGVPVFGGYATVSIAKETRTAGYALDRRAREVVAATAGATIDGAAAVDAAKAAVVFEEARGEATAEQVYFPDGSNLTLAWQVVLPTLRPFGDWLIVVGARDGEVLLKRNVLQFDTGQVFDPNPVVTSGGTVPPPSHCDSGANATSLSPQYRSKTLLGILGGQGKLKGEYVDLTAPGIIGSLLAAGQADEPSHVYTYPCNDPRFEEVMAYYHIDTVQRKLQSLGFTGKSSILARPVPVHAHYDPGPPPADGPDYACNAFYDPFDQGLHFGDFPARCNFGYPTDTGEDGDWIIHEYGHALQNDQVPDFALGGIFDEPSAIGEGFGDFLAAAMTGNPCWAEWVSIGDAACGQPGLRWLQNTKTYPADYNACYIPEFDVVEPHCAGEIWGGALWDLVEALGNDQAARDVALTLVMDSHFYLDPLATFADGAAAIRQADEDLFGGIHGAAITSVFDGRGIPSNGAPFEVPYAYFRIQHPFRGDLEVTLLVGSTSSPVCSYPVITPNPSDGGAALPISFPLEFDSCSSFLPPTPARPWRLRVQDHVENDVGTIDDFQIALAGTRRCIAADVPFAIPDGGAAVYSVVDCSTTAQALPTVAQPSTPTATATQPPAPTATSPPDATATLTPTHTATRTATLTPTDTPTRTPTRTATRTATRTPTRPAGAGPGDVDCSRSVLPTDATIILQFFAGLLDELDCPENGDVNGDGRTDAVDALLVLQYVAGLIDSL